MTDKQRMEDVWDVSTGVFKGLEKLMKEGVISSWFVFRITMHLTLKQAGWMMRNFSKTDIDAFKKEVEAKKALYRRKYD